MGWCCMNDLLALIGAKYTPPIEQPKPRGHNRAHYNKVRNDRMTVSVHSALEKIGRPATRGEIARTRGKSIDHASLERVPGIKRSGGKSKGRAAWFYWFEDDPT